MMFEQWRKMTNMLLDTELPFCMPSPPDKRDWQFATFMGGDSLPAEFIRTTEMPPVRDQGKYGTCVGYAAWAVKSWQERQQGDEPAGGLSPLFIYSMCKQMDGIPGQPGTYPRIAMQVQQKYGVCSEQLMPYSLLVDDKNPPPPSDVAVQDAVKYRISNYAQICSQGDKDRTSTVEQIKRAIVEQGPVLGALLVCDNFMNPMNGVVPLPEGTIRGGHAITIIGYSDVRQAFLLQNSWGTSWGLDGLAWLPYSWVTHRIDDMWWAFFEAWTALDLSYQIKSSGHIILRVDDKQALVDGTVETLDQHPIVVASTGRTLVPLRFVAEHMGYIVNWQEGTRTIELRKPN